MRDVDLGSHKLEGMTTGSQFLFDVPPELDDFFDDVVLEMMVIFDIPKAEAVARINRHWRGHKFRPDDIVQHGLPAYWAEQIYYREVFGAGRVDRIPRPPPDRDSGCWTVA
jgi:hypothetical protein